jgi:hypothetical protein
VAKLRNIRNTTDPFLANAVELRARMPHDFDRYRPVEPRRLAIGDEVVKINLFFSIEAFLSRPKKRRRQLKG